MRMERFSTRTMAPGKDIPSEIQILNRHLIEINLMIIFTGYMVQWQWGLSMMRRVKLSCFQESMAGFKIGTPLEMSVLWVRKGEKDVI